MKQRATLIYDGECKFCIASEKILRRFVGWKLHSTPYQAPHALQLHPKLTAENAQSRLHLVVETSFSRDKKPRRPQPFGAPLKSAKTAKTETQLFAGMEAVAQTLALRPIGKIALIYYFPPLRRVLDALYNFIARHRYQIFGRVVGGCEDGVCQIPQKSLENAQK